MFMCDIGMIDAQKYINIDCRLVFNIKREQWLTNTIYLSVLKHLTLYIQTDLNGFWRGEEG